LRVALSTRAYSCALLCIFTLCVPLARAESASDSSKTGSAAQQPITPDIRDDEVPLKLRKGDVVVVPVPIVSPTVGSGLVVGGAYFYSQSEQQKKSQPASVTAAAGMYTNNDSKLFGIAQQNYWNEDTWRFGAAAGFADLNLSLLAPTDTSPEARTAWNIRGAFAYSRISRKVGGRWYLGIIGRFVDFDQSVDASIQPLGSDFVQNSRTAGFGALAENDTRDMPLNAYDGRLFQASVLLNDEAFGSDDTYQSYKLVYRSYSELSIPLVLAWEVQGCLRSGKTPRWDACRVNLRGFSAMDYLGKNSVSAQIEARWRMSKRWGLVGFAGGGYYGQSFSGIRDNELIPSYGAGVRFTVLSAKRINLRLDYARSTNSDAIHVSVGEAF